MPRTTDRPPGFSYVAEFLSAAEESAVIQELEPLEYQQVVMMGQPARRTVVHYGWDYNYEGWQIVPTTPPPAWLRDLGNRAAARAGIDAAAVEQFLIARYPAGATIGWHRDAQVFGEAVIGVSLRTHCAMKLRRKVGDVFETYTQLLEPRSLYVLNGASRSQWQHSIPAVKELRYSISMRTLRGEGGDPATAKRRKIATD